MTTIEFTHAVRQPRGLIASGVDRLRQLAAALGQRVALRDAERTLHGMSDHMLKDIGISRADIHRRIRGLD
jgi:uncharacterized protein YjiS (DUF1127 family)